MYGPYFVIPAYMGDLADKLVDTRTDRQRQYPEAKTGIGLKIYLKLYHENLNSFAESIKWIINFI